jgi:large subunit ribosomal protein L25
LETIELKADIRTTTGKEAAKAMRREGRIPAVLYGADAEAVTLSVDMKELKTLFRKSGSGYQLISLVLGEEGAKKQVMIKELQTDPVTASYLHADFYEVTMDRKIAVNVSVIATGISKGVEEGGVLQIIRRELEVLCFPNKVPESIEIDITELEIGDSVHIDEIAMEEGVETTAEGNFTVLTIGAPQKIEEEVEEEEEGLEGEEGEEGEEGAEAGEEAKKEASGSEE